MRINFLPTSLLTGIAFVALLSTAQAQNGSMALNTDGSQADNSALLDVKSTTQGVLVPRMNAQQRGLIGSPATGLLVYQTDGTAGFYFYNGTAWTSLSASGTTGPQGPQGLKGDTGAKGDKGDTGLTGPQGLKGDKGDAGATGPAGSGSTGPQGPQGPTGLTGPAGLQGAKGDKGDAGAAGTTGAKGDKGDTGAAGTTGAKGDKGDTGLAGTAGAKGDTGPAGATGQGVPTGGTAGQVLSKVNGTDYNTQWTTPSGGSSGASLVFAAVKTALTTQPVSNSLDSAPTVPFENATTTPPTGVGSWDSSTYTYTVGASGAGLYLIDIQLTDQNGVGIYPMVDINGAGDTSPTSLYGIGAGSTQTLRNPYRGRGVLSHVAYLSANTTLVVRSKSASSVFGSYLNGDASCYFRLVKLN